MAERVQSPSWDAGPDPDVSVVVSTRDRAHFLTGLMEALEAQTLAASRFEVVLVDDGSTDGTWELLTRRVPTSRRRMSALRLGASSGQAAGRNAGVEAARASVLAFTDDDCLPAPGWLDSLTEPFRPPAAGRPPAAVVAQGLTRPWPVDEVGCGPWDRSVWVLEASWRFETCNVAYRRDDFSAAGGFPPRESLPAGRGGKVVGEDAVLGWRVVERGAELVFREEALVHHRHLPASYGDYLRDCLGRRVFPDLVARSPLGRRALWHRWFLSPRSAAADLALAGVGAAGLTRRLAPLAAALPWLRLAWPEARQRPGRPAVVRLAQLAVGDLVGAAALGGASVRHRTPVL